MGITIIRNGVITDRPAEENDSGPAGDGRTYLPYASKTYHVDGTADVVTGRAFNSAIQLPASGNISNVRDAPKQAEASEFSQIDSLRQAKADVDPSLRMLQDARDQDFQRAVSQQAQIDAAIASATHLVQTGSVPGTNNASFVVKPTKS